MQAHLSRHYPSANSRILPGTNAVVSYTLKKRRFSLKNTSLHITFCISIKFYTYPKINSIKSKIFLTVNNILYSYIFIIRVWGWSWRSGIIRFHDTRSLCPHTREPTVPLIGHISAIAVFAPKNRAIFKGGLTLPLGFLNAVSNFSLVPLFFLKCPGFYIQPFLHF